MENIRLNLDRANLLNSFKKAAQAVEAEVFISSGIKELAAEISAFCRKKGINALPSTLPTTGIWHELELGLTQTGLTLLRDLTRDLLEDYNAGLNAATFGIADTGTLVFFETSAMEIRPGTIPAQHMVVLKSGDIHQSASGIAGEIDAFILEHLTAGKPCRVSLISGPSRTADIERTLTVGVHGPKALAIFILDDPPQIAGGTPA
jgi:L-lactate dehydrogenase complex protein LldG